GQQARAGAGAGHHRDRRSRPARAGGRAGRHRRMSRGATNHEPGRRNDMLAIIGGSGLAKLTDLSDTRRQVVRTPYGDPSCALTFGRIGATDIVFLARHGYGHTLTPHEIHYRANIWALREVGAQRIIAVATVGGIREDLGPGEVVIPDQIIDYTHGREATYFEGSDATVTHVDFTEPYDAGLRRLLLEAATRAGEPAH